MPDYTTIFEVLGRYARAFSQLDNLAARNLSFNGSGETFRSFDKLREEFLEVLNDGPSERDRLDAVSILSDAARVANGWATQLQQSLNAWVRDALASELNAEGASEPELLRELQRVMLGGSESVAPNTVALGSVMADTNNTGDAPCYVSKQTVDAEENVVDDERVRNQRIAIECTRDSAHHRIGVGQEEFRIRPERGASLTTRVVPVTVGDVTDVRNVITDGAFSGITGGSFDHWSVISGGGVFSQEITTKLFGDGSLKVLGDGATAGDLCQDLVDRDPPLESGRIWALGVWAYVGAYTGGSVTVDLLIDGIASALTLTIDGSTPTAQWLHLGGFEYLPRASFPNKVKARVRCSSDFDGTVFLDGLSLALATEVPHAGIRTAIFQGATAPQGLPIADRYLLDTTSDEGGAFQVFARDRLGIALPSSGSPTISDSLAE